MFQGDGRNGTYIGKGSVEERGVPPQKTRSRPLPNAMDTGMKKKREEKGKEKKRKTHRSEAPEIGNSSSPTG
jgi:hypothetical protein